MEVRKKGRKERKERMRLTHQSQSAMSAHAMSEDAHPFRIDLFEVVENGLGELGGDVAVHFVSLAPRRIGRVDVEAGAASEVVRFVFAFDLQTSWNPIRYAFRQIGGDRMPYVGSCPGRARQCPSRSQRAGRIPSPPHCPRCRSNRRGISRGELYGGDWWWFEGAGRD